MIRLIAERLHCSLDFVGGKTIKENPIDALTEVNYMI